MSDDRYQQLRAMILEAASRAGEADLGAFLDKAYPDMVADPADRFVAVVRQRDQAEHERDTAMERLEAVEAERDRLLAEKDGG